MADRWNVRGWNQGQHSGKDNAHKSNLHYDEAMTWFERFRRQGWHFVAVLKERR